MLCSTALEYSSMPKQVHSVQKILLIDDDPLFRSLFSLVGRDMGYSVTAYEAMSDMTSFAFINNYDVAVLDYYLQGFTGVEIAEYVDVFFPKLAVFLVSGDSSILDLKALPTSVCGVFKKSRGIREIITEATSPQLNA